MTPAIVTNVILTAIGMALLVFGLCMIYCESRRFVDVKTITNLLMSLGDKFEVLGRVCAASQPSHERNAILIVDDSQFDTDLIRGLCASLADKHDLVMTFANSIDATYSLFHSARVIVLDVVMDQTTISRLNALIDIAAGACPVIVNSANEYPDGTFPKATAVCQKWDAAHLLAEIEKAIRQ